MKRKALLSIVLLVSMLPSIAIAGDGATGAPQTSAPKQIVMVIGNRMFHDLEYFEVQQVFKKEKFAVTVASSTLTTAVGMGMKELTVKPDIRVKDIQVKNFDAVVFLGGPGAHEFTSNRVAHRVVQQAVKQHKILAAIHLGPEILANAGVLEGKRAVSYLSHNIKAKGAIVTDNMVERDGAIITARSQGASTAFGEAIVAALRE